MPSGEVVELADVQDELGLEGHQCTCANPRCDETFFLTPGPGRRRAFHDEDCRRRAERDLRRTLARLAQRGPKGGQLRARARAYVRRNFEGLADQVDGPSDEQRQAAREALAEV